MDNAFSNKSLKKTIVLVDTIWLGHHPTYFKLFCGLIIQSGHKVIALCPREKEMKDWKDQNGYTHEQIEIVHFDPTDKRYKIFFIGPLFSTYLQWFRLARKIKTVQAIKGVSVDLVFFPWLDNYLFPFISPLIHQGIFSYSWSGIYFHPYYLRKRFKGVSKYIHLSRLNIFQSRKFVSLGILDEGILPEVQQHLKNKQVEVLPDFADPALPDRSSELIKEIYQRSIGKKVISLVGSIAKRKGVLTFINIARKFPLEDCLFVVAGQIIKKTFSAEEYALLMHLRDNTPANCFFYFERMKNEAEFNALVELSDVIYACYEEFPHSSNILAKASIFRKPAIVSNKYCMGERIRKYTIGEVVDETDPDKISQTLVRMIQGKREFEDICYTTYLHEHSLPMFGKIFSRLIHI